LVVGLVGEAFEKLGEIGARELPLEGRGGLFVATSEADEAGLDVDEVGEVVGVSTLRCTTEKKRGLAFLGLEASRRRFTGGA
jgi:hypothetical protein